MCIAILLTYMSVYYGDLTRVFLKLKLQTVVIYYMGSRNQI